MSKNNTKQQQKPSFYNYQYYFVIAAPINPSFTKYGLLRNMLVLPIVITSINLCSCLSPRLYFSNTFNKSLFMPSGILLNATESFSQES